MLYGQLRAAVPVIDAAIGKIVRLTGDFRLVCDSRRFQPQLDAFVREVPVGLTGQSLQCFADSYLDSRHKLFLKWSAHNIMSVAYGETGLEVTYWW